MTKTQCSLLIVDDEPYILAALASVLGPHFDVLTASGPHTAMELLQNHPIDLILSDQRMPGMTGVELLEWVRKHSPKTVRLLITGFAELEEAVAAINQGQVFRFLFKPWRAEELLDTMLHAARTFMLERSHEGLLAEMQRLNEELEERVAQRTRQLEDTNHELEQKNKMLEKLALTDPLTGLPNRRAMDRLAERELRRRDRYPSPLALGLVDVDHFKAINSRHLIPGGDKVLMDLSRALLGSLRTVDFLGRIGGEEFLAIAPETGLEGAMILGERIRSTIEKSEFGYNGAVISVTVSVGFAVIEPGTVVEYENTKLVAAAALAEAKMTGRNRCVFHTVGQRPFEQAS